ncbi:anthrone oxygenase family protein [Patulibacter defluvii]|uniref:anthrone oxygenase family protein n=1 Tax=Patulibacter defluvii TaxID=3095358 RepID=UPI002A75CFD4|nr:anthrone oxygenase family protein [Patulibacter sp. DM4]
MGDGTVRGLTIATLVGSGVVGGVFFAFSTFVMRGLRDLPSAQGIRAMQAINVHAPSTGLGALMTVTLLLGLALVVVALTDWSAGGAAWRLGGGVAYLASFVITPAFHIPRNDALDRLDPESAGAAAHWSTYVHEWTLGNHVRGGLAILACVLLAVALTAD